MTPQSALAAARLIVSAYARNPSDEEIQLAATVILNQERMDALDRGTETVRRLRLVTDTTKDQPNV